MATPFLVLKTQKMSGGAKHRHSSSGFCLNKTGDSYIFCHVKKKVGLGNIGISYKTQQPHTQTVVKDIET